MRVAGDEAAPAARILFYLFYYSAVKPRMRNLSSKHLAYIIFYISTNGYLPGTWHLPTYLPTYLPTMVRQPRAATPACVPVRTPLELLAA